MDVRTGKLIVALFLVFASVSMLITYIGFDPARPNLETTDVQPTGVGQTRLQWAPIGGGRRSDDEAVLSTRRLRSLLERNRARLKTRTAELAQQQEINEQLRNTYDQLLTEHQQLSGDYQQLWQEADSQIALLDELLAEGVADAERVDASAIPAASNQAQTARDREIALEILQLELEQAQNRVTELELASIREMVVAAASTDAIVDIGEPGVPMLVTLLANENPDVRQWAATVLGRIGPSASAGVDGLLRTLNDREARVVEAARSALDLIQAPL